MTLTHGLNSSNKHAPIAVPLQLVHTDSSDEGYLLNVSVGTPSQHFGLTLDSDFNALHVFSVQMQEPTDTSCAADITRKRFNETASKTYVDFGGFNEDVNNAIEPYENLCTTDGYTVGGWYSDGFNDTVQIGAVRQSSVPAWLIVGVNAPLNPSWKADGFFGIGPSHKEYAWDSTIAMFLQGFEHPQITLYYARVEVDDGKDGGVVTFGGPDTDNCDSEWIGNYTMDESRNDCGLCLILKSASIGGRTLRSGQNNNVVAKSSFITAPQSAFDIVVKVTGAEYDFKSDTYQVDCDKRAAMPDMVFQLPDLEYRLPAVDYARKLSVRDNRCTLMLMPSNEFSDDWSLGTAFFRPYCALVDYSTQSFWLSKVRH